jgi:hypothetical protein
VDAGHRSTEAFENYGVAEIQPSRMSAAFTEGHKCRISRRSLLGARRNDLESRQAKKIIEQHHRPLPAPALHDHARLDQGYRA